MTRRQDETNRRIGLTGALALALTTLGFNASAADGGVSKFTGVKQVVNNCSVTTAFQTMNGMTQTFTTGGTSGDEVVVMFQATFSGVLDTFDTVFVRLTIDNTVQPTNVSVPIFGGANGSFTHGFNWISKALPPGNHTARIQWRTDLGSSACVDDRSLVILHQ
jgi:hypothetical protein